MINSEVSNQPFKQEIGGKLIDEASRMVSRQLNHLSSIKINLAKRLSSAQTGIRTALLITTLTSAGCGNVNVATLDQNNFTDKENSLPSSQTLELAPIPIFKTINIEGVEFTLDENNVPISYKTPEGKIVNFDRDQLEITRKKATSSKEPEIHTVIDIPENSQVATQTQNSHEHPVMQELPQDILSEQELQARGINILQSDNTQLYIRSKAFEKDGPLADYSPDNKNQLKIVLLNAPLVSDAYMNDPKYKDIQKIYQKAYGKTRTDLEQFRSEQIQEIQQEIETVRKEAKPDESFSQNNNFYKNNLIALKLEQYRLEHADKEELLTRIVPSSSDDIGGLFFSNVPINIDQTGSLVILAVGKTKAPKNSLAVVCDSNGNFSIMAISNLSPNMEPKADQSHPNPNSLSRNPQASSDRSNTYPYAAQSAGFALRHELEHNVLISGPLRKVRTGDFKNKDGSINFTAYTEAVRNAMLKRNKSEYDTDEKAMTGIRAAWERWQSSGYKDNSGYYFIFRLPTGGYILTEKTPNTNIQVV